MVFNCDICMGSLEEHPNSDGESDIKVIITQCGHVFHDVCFEAWERGNAFKSCPYCREMCFPGSLTRVYPSTDRTLEMEHVELVQNCEKVKKELNVAKVMSWIHEERIKLGLARNLALESENLVLRKRLRDAREEILRSVPVWSLNADSNRANQEEFKNEPPPPPSIMKKLRNLMGRLNITNHRNVKVHPFAQGPSSEEKIVGCPTEVPQERPLRLNDRTGLFEEAGDDETWADRDYVPI